MARQPVDTISALQTRDALWAVIRNLKRSFTARELRRETCCSSSQTGEYLKGLTAAGILSATDDQEHTGPIRRKIYTLEKDSGVVAPRVRKDGSQVTQGASRHQIWATMRVLGTFDYRSLAITASTEEVPVAETEANSYCQALAKAGYLKIVTPSKPGTPATYRFLPGKYTGPRPPQIQRVKSIYDPNLKKVVWDEVEGCHD